MMRVVAGEDLDAGDTVTVKEDGKIYKASIGEDSVPGTMFQIKDNVKKGSVVINTE